MVKLGKFQTLTFNHWKGLTRENHLGSIFQLEPQKATNVMVQLLATRRGKSLETYLSQFPVKYFDTEDEYTWDVVSSSRRNIPLVEARHIDGTTVDGSEMAGVGGEPFFVVFPEDWFADGNVIVGELNEIYPLRILGEARMEGTNACYKVELMGGITTGMPAKELKYGKRFSVEYSPVEKELSRGVGDIRFTSPISMRNEWSRIRIKHKVPGSMLNKKLAVGISFLDNKTGKEVTKNMWMHYVDYELEEQFSDEKNNLIMYGRSNRNDNGEYMNFGKSGSVIKMGAGLREQTMMSNVTYYTKFSLKLLEDALYAISSSKLDLNDRVFVLRTGERGAAQFSKAVLNEVSGWSAFQINADNLGMIQKTTSPFHQNSLAAGFQFTEFRAPMGVVLKVEVDPLYDDTVRNKIMHPDGGVAESYRYDILYIGTADQPNIQMARLRGQDEIRGYKWGLRNPFTGQMGNDNMSTDEDSAEIHKMWTGGVFVLDPTRSISLVPSILNE
jgi:hypothetical protein